MSIFIVPFIGYFVDKKGKRLMLLNISAVLTIMELILMLYIPPLIPCFLGGIACSLLFAIKRPLLALIVDKPEIVIYLFIIIFKGLGYGI